MSEKPPANNFESIKDTSQINAYFIKNYNGESYEEYFLEVEIQYLEILHELRNDSPFLPVKIRIEKVEKLVTNLQDKTKYVIHIRNSKQALNDGLVLKNVHRMNKFN